MTRATAAVYLVRHGETDWNASDRCQGSADVPMNAAGIEQIMLLAAQIRAVRFDAAFTSPLCRARRTAELLLGECGLRPIELDPLIELSYGSYQGRTPAEWEGDTAALWKNDPWSLTFPRGESLSQLRDRLRSAMDEILTGHAGRCILVSGHGHANRVLLIDALALEPDSFWEIAQPNGAAYRLDFQLASTGEWVAESATPVGGSHPGNTINRREAR